MVLCRDNVMDFTLQEQVAISKNLRYLRKKKELTLTQASKLSEIPRGSLACYESYGSISRKRLEILANTYEIPIDLFVMKHEDFVNVIENL